MLLWLVILTSDHLIQEWMGFHGLIVEHFYVKFGDSSWSGFWVIVQIKANMQTSKRQWKLYPHEYRRHPAGDGVPLSCLFLPLSIHFLIFCSVYFSLFPLHVRFTYFLLLSIPFPFYQNSHHSVSRPEIVGGDPTWV